MGSTSEFSRRDLIKRAAALGLVAVPAMSALSACASGGDDDDAKPDKPAGGGGGAGEMKPLKVNASAPLDVVIFDGGFGQQYAKDAEAEYKKAYPQADIKHTGTQDIAPQIQPRFNGGTPPDLIDNSGAKQMDLGTLVGLKQLTDLNALLDAPSLDDPKKKVRDTLRPGVVEMGQFDGDEVWVFYYAYTVYGVWYSKTNLEKLDAQYPETWDEMLKLCEKAKKKGIAGWTYAGQHPYYIPFSLYPFIAKIGGTEVLDRIDNLEPDAWKHPAVKAAFEAYYELYKKGYILRGTAGLDHIQSQTAWNEGKALFIPNGSWVENESKKMTPKDFRMAVGAPSSLDKSDKMPFGTIWASGGEPFIVPKNAKNAQGGMELLRIMLGKKSTQNFIKAVSSLTSLNGGTEGLTLPPGLASSQEALTKAGRNVVNPRLQDWYVSLQKEKIGKAALGLMMDGRLTPDEAIKKIQKYTDETRKDDSVKKYKHK
ncbi:MULTISPECIES: N-acetylglucosamine/diacetylchitobiose ABC transporter substrate-binding protein [Streptomyces]|uniref:N-acetylglucosamine/diacetylchitobiose ABC transporter substrate-binding protein n=1 Tax=Streptomyces TaxID=1883 RepID=UPI00163C51DC|nr:MULTISPECIES: N-acetylglucosamine/diacetylchitobiose ABC transporter substrate-binding protein [Streptomyces]MBC2876664.1 carbohydrate ABC transporter, N-acetylglucosamine/diacetylchitobiose-binding protein [Streptomyces sp. TYQ1024]UBI36294.1 N-acetylglucosamine/diacetylchitobiose ABC transporter substrate-binding protein [Streptomyces mobaraensis]UKW28888.1 N-acetylglucosamine/diacetylchitobiose ABC transporter substrate-binding protein [Streptomyces sp. TYQ1024]